MPSESEVSLWVSPRLRLWLGVVGAGVAAGLAWLGWKITRRSQQVTVAALYVYPIKGCRGHSVAKAKVTKWGLENDRIYMIVDEKNEFVSQRLLPRMALIHPDLPTESGITLRAAADAAQPLTVPVELKSTPKNVKVWDDWVPAVDQGDAAAQWLCTVLQTPKLRLVRIAETAQRVTDPKYGAGETAFSDGFPVLVSSTASIRQISRKVLRDGGPQVGIDRFRPNIHVDGCRPFEEDEMRALVYSLGARTLRLPLVKPCSRCTVPGVDQQTGERNRQTGGVLTETMRSLRTAEVLLPAAVLHKEFFSEPRRKQDVYFGQNALVELSGAQHFEITVGDIAAVEWQ